MDESKKDRDMVLDEMADFHQRLGRCESFEVALSRRVTAIEESNRGHYVDDPMAGMSTMIWVMVLLTVAPIVLEMVREWQSSRSSS